MWNEFVGGIYLIILNKEILDKFDFFFPRIVFSLKRALRNVKYFLNILFVISNENEDEKFTLSDKEIHYLLLRLLFYFYSFSCSISLDENFKHLKVKVFPLVVPFSGVLSKTQAKVLQHFFTTKDVEFSEKCHKTKEIGLFYCKLIRHQNKNDIFFPSFEWNVLKEIKCAIYETQVSCIELPLLVHENMCHFQMNPPDLSFFKFHETIVVAGTFDHLHEGHQLLLNAAALLAQKNSVICIVQDNSSLLNNKKIPLLLLPCVYRVKELYKYILRFLCLIGESGHNIIFNKELMMCCLTNTRLLNNEFIEMLDIASSTIDIGIYGSESTNGFFMISLMGHFVISSNIVYKEYCEEKKSIEFLALNDAIGPAANRSDFTCLIVTPDTQKGAIIVNNERQANGLKHLDIIILPFIEPLIFIKTSLQKPLFLRHTNIQISDILLKDELQRKQCFSNMLQQENKIPYNNEIMKKTLSSTQLRQMFMFHSPTCELYEWWLFLCTLIDIPSNVSRVWGQYLLYQLLNIPWRKKTIDFLKQSMNFYWKKIIHVENTLKEKNFIWICLWFFCLVDTTFFDHLFFEKNTFKFHYELITQNLNKLIKAFCNDLYWFSDKNVQHSWRSTFLPSNNEGKHSHCFFSNCTYIHTSTLPASIMLTFFKYDSIKEILNLMDLHNNLCHVAYCIVNQAWCTKNSLKTHDNLNTLLLSSNFPIWKPPGLTFYFEKLYPNDQNIPLMISTLLNHLSVKEIFNDHAYYLVSLMPLDLFKNFNNLEIL
jgi:phosphopantetheine adenylyltransferase